ncbi:regulatory protein RecX [Parasphingorhabdus pacifica]
MSAADDPEAGREAPVSSATEGTDTQQLARDVVYRLLAVRARSRAELRQALLRKEIDEEVAEDVLRKFVDAGLVDDAAFAESWVHERHQYQGLGRKALGFELRRKGVEEHLVAEALSTVDEEAEVERARELVRRKMPAMARVDSTKRTRRLVGMLARKGYGEGLAFRVVREEIEHFGFPDADVEVDE